MTVNTTIHLHFGPDDIRRDFKPPSADGPGYATLDIGIRGGTCTSLFFRNTETVDAAIRELAALKSAMLGEQPSWCTATTDLDGETLYCDREPGHDGSHHAPGVDEGSEIGWSDGCTANCPVPGLPYVCTLYAGHEGPHEAWGDDEDAAIVSWPVAEDGA